MQMPRRLRVVERGVRPEVLLIEDDPQIRRFLRPALIAEEYRLYEAVTGEEGVAQAAARQPDIIVLDLGLPGIDGFEVIRKVREWSRTPIIILSARGREIDKITALDLGADDYVSKPFGIGELLARLRAALRRSGTGATPGTVFTSGDLKVDLEKRLVHVGSAEVHLTPVEYKLLNVLVTNAGKVITQRQLLNEVWGPQHLDQPEYLRVYMAQLRRKLESDPARPRYLLTEPGVGYRLVTE